MIQNDTLSHQAIRWIKKITRKRKTKEKLKWSNSLSEYLLIYFSLIRGANGICLHYLHCTNKYWNVIFQNNLCFYTLYQSVYIIINRVNSVCFSEKLKQKCGIRLSISELRFQSSLNICKKQEYNLTGVSSKVHTVNLSYWKVLDDDVKGGGSVSSVALRHDGKWCDESVPRSATDRWLRLQTQTMVSFLDKTSKEGRQI